MSNDLKSLLGLKPFSPELTAHILALATATSKSDAPTPEVKSYSDAVYFNYYPLGLSLLFKPVNGYRPKTGLKLEELQNNNLVLDGIDIYNVPKPKAGANASRSTKSPIPPTLSRQSSSVLSRFLPTRMGRHVRSQSVSLQRRLERTLC